MLLHIPEMTVPASDISATTRDNVLGASIVILRSLLPRDHPSFAIDELRRVHGSRRVNFIVQRALEDLPGAGWDLPSQMSHNAALRPYIDTMSLEISSAPSPAVKACADSLVGSDAHLNGATTQSACTATSNESLGDCVTPLTPTRAAVRDKRSTPSSSTPHRNKLKLFAANVDMDRMKPQLDALVGMLPNYLRWGREYDALHFIKQPVHGVSLPQLYLKAKGCWTGGHEENLRLSSVNCNHGPGESRWYAIDSGYAPRLREFVLRTHSIDIYQREGNWWPRDIQILIKAGIPVRTGIQRPGDAIVLRGSTLHWVVALSASVHSSWNLGVCDALQFKEALDRAAMNDLGATCVPNIVHFRTLVCDVSRALLKSPQPARRIRHRTATKLLVSSPKMALMRILQLRPKTVGKRLVERVRSDPELLETIALCVANTLELEAINLRKITKFGIRLEKEQPGSVVMRCDICASELPLVYLRCETCLAARYKQRGARFLCAECGCYHMVSADDESRHEVIAIVKGSLSELRRLAVRLEFRRHRVGASTNKCDPTDRVGQRCNSISPRNSEKDTQAPMKETPAISIINVHEQFTRYRDRRLTETALFPVFNRSRVNRRTARDQHTARCQNHDLLPFRETAQRSPAAFLRNGSVARDVPSFTIPKKRKRQEDQEGDRTEFCTWRSETTSISTPSRAPSPSNKRTGLQRFEMTPLRGPTRCELYRSSKPSCSYIGLPIRAHTQFQTGAVSSNSKQVAPSFYGGTIFKTETRYPRYLPKKQQDQDLLTGNKFRLQGPALLRPASAKPLASFAERNRMMPKHAFRQHGERRYNFPPREDRGDFRTTSLGRAETPAWTASAVNSDARGRTAMKRW